MCNQTNDPHDVRQKELLNNKEAFISLLKDCVKADWIDDLDVDSLKRSNASFILQDFKKKEADIVYEATINNGKQKVIFYLLLELQSWVDFRMPYRLLLYIVEILRHYYNNSDFDARSRKGFKFPAVIPIIFYSGSGRWTVPTSLREMFNGQERFGDSILNFTYALVDVKGYDDKSVKGFQSRLLKVMMMFENTKDATELRKVIQKYEGDIKQFNDEERRIISVAADIFSERYGPDEAKKISEALLAASTKEVDGMLSDWTASETKKEKQLKRQIKAETAKRYLEMGLTVEQVAKGSDLSIEEVEEIRKGLPMDLATA